MVQITGFIMSIISFVLFTVSIIISIKSRTGTNIPQLICLLLGEIFAWTGIIFMLFL